MSCKFDDFLKKQLEKDGGNLVGNINEIFNIPGTKLLQEHYDEWHETHAGKQHNNQFVLTEDDVLGLNNIEGNLDFKTLLSNSLGVYDEIVIPLDLVKKHFKRHFISINGLPLPLKELQGTTLMYSNSRKRNYEHDDIEQGNPLLDDYETIQSVSKHIGLTPETKSKIDLAKMKTKAEKAMSTALFYQLYLCNEQYRKSMTCQHMVQPGGTIEETSSAIFIKNSDELTKDMIIPIKDVFDTFMKYSI